MTWINFRALAMFAILTWVVPTQAATHPAAEAVSKILNQGLQIINTSGSGQFTQLCGFAKNSFHNTAIANQMLGNYQNLARDQAGVKAYRDLFPSILIDMIYSQLDKAQGGKFTVYNNVRARDQNTFEVPANIRTAGGDSYNVTMVIFNSGNRWLLIDAMAFGMSGVSYLKRDVQKDLNHFYNQDTQNSLPVTSLVKTYLNDASFNTCP